MIRSGICLKIPRLLPIERLRLTGAGSGSSATLSTDNNNLEQQAVTVRERRRSPRFNCEGPAEIARIPSTGRRKGKISDISVAGCFIVTDQPFSPGTYVEVSLQLATVSLRIAGSVKNLRKGGMGIAFHCLSDRTTRLLQSLVRELESGDPAK